MKTIKFPGDVEPREIYDEQARNSIGDLSGLNTANKDDLVGAVNEVLSNNTNLDNYPTKDEIPTNLSQLNNDTNFATETYVDDAIANIDTVNIDLSDYALKSDVPTVPTNVSAFTNDAGYLTEHQSLGGYATETYVDDKIEAIPTPDVSGQISTHNTATDSHNDIRLFIEELTTRLNTLADSDDTTLDQMSEIVAYIKSNKTLIEEVTTNKVNVSDIINNLTTNVSNQPLSAAQGVALKALIDAIVIPTKLSQLANDNGYITEYIETDPTVPSWAKTSSKPTYTASEVGALPADTVIPIVPTNVSAFTNDAGYLAEHQDISGKLDASELPTAINTALAQAKESGEFDGEDGAQGAPGLTWEGAWDSDATYNNGNVVSHNGSAYVCLDDMTPSGIEPGTDGSVWNLLVKKGEDGYTPVKGTDYYTEEDKTELVNLVKASLTSETWTFTLEDGSTVSKVVLLA